MSIKSIKIGDIKDLEFDPVDRDPIFFDIETGPSEDLAYMQYLKPKIKAPANYTDPDKIEKYIAKKEDEFMDRAALDPVTGEIVQFGFRYKGQSYCIDEFDDLPDLEQIFLIGIEKLAEASGNRDWVGHNIHDFDLPYIVRRFWRYQMSMPLGWKQGNYWNTKFVDTMRLFALGKFKETISLDRLAKFLGHKEGKGGVDGAKFHELIMTNRQEALDYLDNDLQLTEFCYERIKH